MTTASLDNIILSEAAEWILEWLSIEWDRLPVPLTLDFHYNMIYCFIALLWEFKIMQNLEQSLACAQYTLLYVYIKTKTLL